MIKRKTCKKTICKYRYQLRCSICCENFHLSCIEYLNSDEFKRLKESNARWSCLACLEELFPFNNIADNNIFLKTTTDLNHTGHNIIDNLNEDINNQLKLFDDNFDSKNSDLLGDVNPDAKFYEIDDLIDSKYYDEKIFKDKIQLLNLKENYLSMLHFNIRSAPKNMVNFENFLYSLNTEFSLIGLTETWFNNVTADLYDMQRYSSVHNYRTGRTGGGVSIFVKSDISFHKRCDLFCCDNELECVFIEIGK